MTICSSKQQQAAASSSKQQQAAARYAQTVPSSVFLLHVSARRTFQTETFVT